MPGNNEESRTVKTAWTVTIQGAHVTIPAEEQIKVARDAQSGSIRVFWSGFQKKQLGFSAPVSEDDLAAHT